MQYDRILRRKSPAAITNRRKVFHLPFRTLPGEPGFHIPMQLEVCPQCRTEKSNAAEFERTIIQNVNIGWRGRLQFIDGSDVVSVELVIARNVNNRRIGKPATRLFDATRANTNVARKNHDIGIGFRG
jgi:hypothetical protein